MYREWSAFDNDSIVNNDKISEDFSVRNEPRNPVHAFKSCSSLYFVSSVWVAPLSIIFRTSRR